MMPYEKETKSIAAELFKKHNKLDFDVSPDKVSLKDISGISNAIYKVYLDPSDSSFQNIPYKSFLFRWFGKISYLVHRQLEKHVMNGLNKLNIGPAIIATDEEKYRVEEFIENTKNISNDELLKPEILNQIENTFLKFYEICDERHYNAISTKYTDKKELYQALMKEEIPNVYNFSDKLKNMASSTMSKFKEELIKDKSAWKEEEYANIIKQVENIERILDISINDLLEACPEIPVLVLSNNDAHPGNLLIDDARKVYVIDHEYACYNYLGFEIANFLLESTFTLDWHEYPHFKQFEPFDTYLSDQYFGIYTAFIEKYFDIFSQELKENGVDIEKAKKHYLEKSIYLRLISASSIYWSLYAIYYIDYENFKNKKGFDYFAYSQLRFSVYEYLKTKYNN